MSYAGIATGNQPEKPVITTEKNGFFFCSVRTNFEPGWFTSRTEYCLVKQWCLGKIAIYTYPSIKRYCVVFFFCSGVWHSVTTCPVF